MMNDPGMFRVRIDLGHFFSDHKSKAYVSVNRQWKNVRQFHRHITDMFDVKKFVLLTSDGVYLPAKEDISIIQSGDLIHVTPKNSDNESVVSALSDAMDTLVEHNIYRHNHSNAVFNETNSATTSIEIIPPKKSNNADDEIEYTESVGTNDTNGSAGSKRKRVRRRKKKSSDLVNNENQMNVPNVEKSVGILKNNPFQAKYDRPKSSTHVRFESDESQSELDEEIMLPKVARVISADVKDIVKLSDIDAEYTIKESIVANEHQDSPQELNYESMEDKANQNPQSALENLSKNLEDSGKYREMNDEVKEMDMIAFKVFSPNFEKSDYVIGLVESIIGKTSPDQQDYDLALQIMAGRNHIEHLNESSDDVSSIRIQINRMDIFDAKIVAL